MGVRSKPATNHDELTMEKARTLVRQIEDLREDLERPPDRASDNTCSVCAARGIRREVEDISDPAIGDIHAIHTVCELTRQDDPHVNAGMYSKHLPRCLSFQAITISGNPMRLERTHATRESPTPAGRERPGHGGTSRAKSAK
jgi:hypothetical protein